jgi:hypothetical protein
MQRSGTSDDKSPTLETGRAIPTLDFRVRPRAAVRSGAIQKVLLEYNGHSLGTIGLAPNGADRRTAASTCRRKAGYTIDQPLARKALQIVLRRARDMALGKQSRESRIARLNRAQDRNVFVPGDAHLFIAGVHE